jgi:hypothetical protein
VWIDGVMEGAIPGHDAAQVTVVWIDGVMEGGYPMSFFSPGICSEE